MAEATLETSLATARTAITTAVEANNTAGIAAAAHEIGASTASEVQADATAQAGFYAILTTDQQTKYKEMPTAGLNGPGHDGRGGPAHH